MNLRLLAPAGPVPCGRIAMVRASFRVLPLEGLRGTWEWDDGQTDEADLDPGLTRTRRTHRYAGSGVYRVRVCIGSDDAGARIRYVTVRDRGQVAASGWIRVGGSPPPVPFGFLITPGAGGLDGTIDLRCVLGREELRANELTWLFVGDPGSLHFGGGASIGNAPGVHPFRVDVRGRTPEGRSDAQQITMSVYAIGAVPGHDSPMHRLSGLVRPGRIDLGPYGPVVIAPM